MTVAAVLLTTAETRLRVSWTTLGSGNRLEAFDSGSEFVELKEAENNEDGWEYLGSNQLEWKSKSDMTRMPSRREQ
jgi:hypothetical protein